MKVFKVVFNGVHHYISPEFFARMLNDSRVYSYNRDSHILTIKEEVEVIDKTCEAYHKYEELCKKIDTFSQDELNIFTSFRRYSDAHELESMARAYYAPKFTLCETRIHECPVVVVEQLEVDSDLSEFGF